jgi:nitrogen fixation protein NifU and related proteins
VTRILPGDLIAQPYQSGAASGDEGALTQTEDLYRSLILDRYRAPHHRRPIENAQLAQTASNPLCGDELTLELRIEDDRLADAGFQARGCSILQASADLMIDAVRDEPVARIPELASRFQMLIREDPSEQDLERLGPLAAFASVRKVPARARCALLPWETLMSMLNERPPSPNPSEDGPLVLEES